MSVSQAPPSKQRNEALARARFNAGLTQKQLAAAAGVSERTIQHLEAGQHPEPTTAKAVSEVLGVAIRDVFTFEAAA